MHLVKKLFSLMLLFYYSTLVKVSPFKGDIWLIGENRGKCLQDNGYFFYLFCKESGKKNIYFVVQRYSPFYEKEFKSDVNVILYGSSRHLYLFCRAAVVLYTHTYVDVMYKTFFNFFSKKKKIIYLHHGVLGFKRFDEFYSKNKNIMNVFTVGSFLEKDILVRDEGVDDFRVKVTGYARYDIRPILSSSESSRTIVYIPTHRNYAKRGGGVQELFQRFRSFLSNKKLLDILNENDLTLNVYLHSEMQMWSELLGKAHGRIVFVRLSEVPVASLISDSLLMITDYSSVSWDFFYLNKPIIFYRFDLSEYLTDRGSYIDLTSNQMGLVVRDEDELIHSIQNCLDRGFIVSEEASMYLSRVRPVLDGGNCQRIYNEVASLGLHLNARGGNE